MGLRLRNATSVLAPAARPESSAPAGGQPPCHADLIDLLIGEAGPDHGAPDIVLLAYAAPDDNPYKTVSTYLNMMTGGGAHSVALCGQGLGAPFTGLRIADAYERAGQSSRSLVVIVESPTPGPDGHAPGSAVLLDLGSEPGTGFGIDAVELTDAPGELAARLAASVPGQGRLLIVCGPGSPAVDPPPGADLRRVPADGGYCTRAWLALARHWREWQAAYPVIALCDADPGSGAVQLAVLRQPRPS
jgi:hypothetical protein